MTLTAPAKAFILNFFSFTILPLGYIIIFLYYLDFIGNPVPPPGSGVVHIFPLIIDDPVPTWAYVICILAPFFYLDCGHTVYYYLRPDYSRPIVFELIWIAFILFLLFQITIFSRSYGSVTEAGITYQSMATGFQEKTIKWPQIKRTVITLTNLNHKQVIAVNIIASVNDTPKNLQFYIQGSLSFKSSHQIPDIIINKKLEDDMRAYRAIQLLEAKRIPIEYIFQGKRWTSSVQ